MPLLTVLFPILPRRARVLPGIRYDGEPIHQNTWIPSRDHVVGGWSARR